MAKEIDASLFGYVSLLGNGNPAFGEVSSIDRNKAMPTKLHVRNAENFVKNHYFSGGHF